MRIINNTFSNNNINTSLGGMTMSKKKNIKTINQAMEAASNDSRNSKNGYMERGNASKDFAQQGTRNKN